MILILVNLAGAGEKPLKIYIMAGQSNMQGKARTSTIERLKLTDDSKSLYDDLIDSDGKAAAPAGVYGVYFTNGDMKKGASRPVIVQKGPLRPSFDQEPSPNHTFGPEYTFGVYMKKYLNEPILIIKTAWGGRDLLQQFRSPSAGKYKEEKDRHGNETGAYYKLMIKHVGDVLGDLGEYHPDYKKENGYEISGFVWFQGYNDLIGPYPSNDYSEYSRLMAAFIRDVRKDLKAPKMPFVIGVMGIGGPIKNTKDKQFLFREAQAAPASMPEFQGNVVAVRTENYWDMELQRIDNKLYEAAKAKVMDENTKLSKKALDKAVKKQMTSLAERILNPVELKIRNTGRSNAAFHYMGSAYTYGSIGKAFAEAMYKLEQ